MRKGIILILGVFLMAAAGLVHADDVSMVEDAFKNGEISGEIGTYYEFKDVDDSDGGDKNFDWATSYATLKYETAKWNDIKLGTRFFAHGELRNEGDEGLADKYDSDIEKKVTLPELYVDYSFGEASNVRLGRFNHKKVSHLDDAQSEGAYVKYSDFEDVDIIVGFMKRFAEIDYDDSEDFGRTEDQQDLGSKDTYGENSKSFVTFAEVKVKLLEQNLTVSPYAYYQDGYAAVYGFDSKAQMELEEIKIGLKTKLYHVESEKMGASDSTNYEIAPFVKAGPVSLVTGYAKFDEGDALNKPAWFKDGLIGYFDQVVAYGQSGAEAYFAMLKVKFGKFWAQAGLCDYDYEFSNSMGDGAQERELQFGYNFTDKLDLNLRLFDVAYDDVDNKDYKKVEARLRFKF